MAISTQRILISNDDGINAPGIAILEKIARQLSDDVWIVAPESEQSWCRAFTYPYKANPCASGRRKAFCGKWYAD